MERLHITIVQTALHWEQPAQNFSMLNTKLAALSSTDVIVLPEMFNTGFSMHSERLAETMDGPTVQWMQSKAQEKDCVITGSLIVKENESYYNRMVWMRPDGSCATYDKRHLFRMAEEHHHFSGGSGRTIVELKGWRLNLQICYDLRFPVWSRNKGDYDCLIYVANWPKARSHPWSSLLIARAIENQAYVIGVNRVGKDGNGIDYSGNSAAIDPKGQVISTIKSCEDGVETVQLSFEELQLFREKFPVGLDADRFEIQ